MTQPTHAELVRVVRDHAGRLAAALVPLVGDFAAAEDLVQDAVEAALTHWPVDGPPPRPGRAPPGLPSSGEARPDGVAGRTAARRPAAADLHLLPPGPATQSQVALTLRVVCGLTTGQIARAFLIPEGTVGQRITGAKRKINDAGIRTGSRPRTNLPAGSPRCWP